MINFIKKHLFKRDYKQNLYDDFIDDVIYRTRSIMMNIMNYSLYDNIKIVKRIGDITIKSSMDDSSVTISRNFDIINHKNIENITIDDLQFIKSKYADTPFDIEIMAYNQKTLLFHSKVRFILQSEFSKLHVFTTAQIITLDRVSKDSIMIRNGNGDVIFSIFQGIISGIPSTDIDKVREIIDIVYNQITKGDCRNDN